METIFEIYKYYREDKKAGQLLVVHCTRSNRSAFVVVKLHEKKKRRKKRKAICVYEKAIGIKMNEFIAEL